MKKPKPVAIYWDPTSVLSALFKDSNSEKALQISKKEGVHFLSSLCYAEVCSVLSEIREGKELKEVLIDVAFETLSVGPWRRLNIWPEWNMLISLSKKLQKQIPELTLLTYDGELRAAAEGEGLLSS